MFVVLILFVKKNFVIVSLVLVVKVFSVLKFLFVVDLLNWSLFSDLLILSRGLLFFISRVDIDDMLEVLSVFKLCLY